RVLASSSMLAAAPDDNTQRAPDEIQQAYRRFLARREHGFLDASLQEWAETWQVIQSSLLSLTPTGAASDTITGLIRLATIEPIDAYREVALLALAQVCAFIPDPACFRSGMRAVFSGILDYGFDDFAFDLTAVLAAEIDRRKLS